MIGCKSKSARAAGRIALVLVGLLVLVGWLGGASAARAAAAVSHYVVGCGSFYAVGTTTAPFVAFSVQNLASHAYLVFRALPDPSGVFEINEVYPRALPGTYVEYDVWGATTSDPNDWDGGVTFSTWGPCNPIFVDGFESGVGAFWSAFVG